MPKRDRSVCAYAVCMTANRSASHYCLVCDRAIDGFHELWFFVDDTRALKVHAGCLSVWYALVVQMDAAGEPFDARGRVGTIHGATARQPESDEQQRRVV
jgi:hypothetical protein